MIRRRLGDDRGSVVAEFAVALPAVALVLLFGMGALAAGARHVRLQDAAADAARLVARGEPDAAASDVVGRAVPGGSAVVNGSGDLVCVTASAPAGIALVQLVQLSATSCALAGGR
ncbi:TadE family type IV pilus minor pilin [Microbacterium sp. F51-2R]|jgi:Flp pilus assembly protein TadG|uniref:TadE family type IV pilus minor pilin n=1 Tax=Microbacterium sp. F51-2R TaxID=3445777 RepID=UPI003F9FB51A